ncbi:MAG: hypothetical protein LCH44_08755 [Bacteroidetes bacterium]|nr:hypothetical protein [Bacteroidota bacterium]
MFIYNASSNQWKGSKEKAFQHYLFQKYGYQNNQNTVFFVILSIAWDNVKISPNSALDNCGIDLRLVINGLQNPLKRFAHRDVPHNQHIRFYKTFTAEFGITVMSYSEKKYGDKSLNDKKLLPLFSVMELKDGIYTFEGTLQRQNEIIYF